MRKACITNHQNVSTGRHYPQGISKQQPMDREIQQQFNRVNDKLNKVLMALIEGKKPVWAKVGFVTRITGWDHETLRQARKQGIIEWKTDPMQGRLYNLNSIPSIFIRHENTNKGGGQLDGVGAITN